MVYEYTPPPLIAFFIPLREEMLQKRKCELPQIFSRHQSFQLVQISVWGSIQTNSGQKMGREAEMGERRQEYF